MILRGPFLEYDPVKARWIARFWGDGKLMVWRFRRDGRKPDPSQIANLTAFVRRQLEEKTHAERTDRQGEEASAGPA